MSNTGTRTFRESYVYRAFDSYGLLLYIGCSQNVAARMAAHQGQPWHPYAETVGIVGPWPRKEALAHEDAAIESEQSFFNWTRADNGRTRRNRACAERHMKPTRPPLDDLRLYDTAYMENVWGPAMDVWYRAHKAMNEEECRRAERGESWMTRCGRRAKAKPNLPKAKVHQVAPIEACVVCCNLPWPGGDDA